MKRKSTVENNVYTRTWKILEGSMRKENIVDKTVEYPSLPPFLFDYAVVDVDFSKSEKECPRCFMKKEFGSLGCKTCSQADYRKKKNTDENGERVWQELKEIVAKELKVIEENEDSMVIDLPIGVNVIEEDISYPVILSKEENISKSELWLEIASPIRKAALFDSVDYSSRINTYLCGGVVKYYDIEFLKTSMLMNIMDKKTVFRTMEIICAGAYELKEWS